MLVHRFQIIIFINLSSPQLGLNMLDAFLLFVCSRISEDDIHIFERLKRGNLVNIELGVGASAQDNTYLSAGLGNAEECKC